VVRKSLLFSRVHVHSYAEIEESVILPDVDIGRGAKLRRVVMDKHCRVPDGMLIGYDTEADRKSFHVSEGGVTLVTPEMLGQQAHHIR
jgi:glucose-1-phosphate adenylyltransferase